MVILLESIISPPEDRFQQLSYRLKKTSILISKLTHIELIQTLQDLVHIAGRIITFANSANIEMEKD